MNVSTHHPNRQLSSIIRSVYHELITQLAHFEKCIVTGLVYDIRTYEENELLVRMNCTVVGSFRKGDGKCISGQIVFAEKSIYFIVEGL